MDTVKGQNILLDEFGKGAFSLVVVEGMEPKDVAAMRAKIEAGRACGNGALVRQPGGFVRSHGNAAR